MTEDEIEDLRRQHEAAGRMLFDYAALAEKHGCQPGESVYLFIYNKLSRLSEIESERRSAALDELGKLDGER